MRWGRAAFRRQRRVSEVFKKREVKEKPDRFAAEDLNEESEEFVTVKFGWAEIELEAMGKLVGLDGLALVGFKNEVGGGG
mmetsp:Transcript_32768/g.45493  ORF Transcript_32768/g.45493 Transcript_32768/m.45493 type:complete len:80 (+) Transcript_32768:160-399(+)